ncbi:MAG: MBOAT family protein [Clostridia bacterium]|nr:MBOAT family protein [Clostridia bacterium]
MDFSLLTFLYVFLPLNLVIYALSKDIRTKNNVMLVFSLIFYAWGEPLFVLLLVGMVAVNWFIALWIGELQRRRKPRTAKRALLLACVVDIAAIGIFKYGTFLLQNTQSLFGFPSFIPEILLPIGISFYTFQILSYVVDVYRGDVRPQRSFRLLLLYISLFHQCIAGPIVRYKDVSEELLSRKMTMTTVSEGVSRFAVGIAKKAVFANHCGDMASQLLGITEQNPHPDFHSCTVAGLWLAMFCYALQIYLDFSAYSDMAIGMGRMIGFHYKENFNYPYIAQSVTDFWRRWHMSLSSFFRDYVYIPLGGNRCSMLRHVFNLLVVWFLTGLWHGASWNFVLWGLYYFVFLVFEKFVLAKYLEKAPRVLRHAYLLIVVYFGWILFQFKDMSQIGAVLAGMFGGNGNAFSDFETATVFQSNWVFLLAAIVACTPFVKTVFERFLSAAQRSPSMATVYSVCCAVVPALLLLLATTMLVANTYNAFLYLQF